MLYDPILNARHANPLPVRAGAPESSDANQLERGPDQPGLVGSPFAGAGPESGHHSTGRISSNKAF